MKNKYLAQIVALALLICIALAFASCSSDFNEPEAAPTADSPTEPQAMVEAMGGDSQDWEDSMDDHADSADSGIFFSVQLANELTDSSSPEEDAQPNDAPANGYEPSASGYQHAEPPLPPQTQGPTPLGVDLMQRMIIRAATMRLSTLYFADTTASIESIVANRGGFVENSRQWMVNCQDAGMLWRAEYVIRVPVGLFDTTNNELMALAQVQYFSTTSQDATHEFNDLGSRLQIREAEEVRVQRMLEEATELADIINLEARLTSLRLVIDAYLRRREEIDQLASFSTINLAVHEVVVLPEIIEEEDEEDEYNPIVYTFSDRIGTAFRASANFTSMALETIGVFLALIILPVGLLGAVLGLILVIIKRVSGRSAREWLRP